MIKLFRKIRLALVQEHRFTKYLLYAVGEIVLVVIGILIALQINNWNETIKTDRNRTKTLAMIKKELLANKKTIDRVFEYHRMVADSLKGLEVPKTEEAAQKSLSFLRGLQINRLRDAAFRTAVQVGTTKDFEVELSEDLNALYTAQEAYNNFGATASNSLYQNDFSDLANFKKIVTFLGMVMVDLYYLETELKEGYAKCLKQVDQYLM